MLYFILLFLIHEYLLYVDVVVVLKHRLCFWVWFGNTTVESYPLAFRIVYDVIDLNIDVNKSIIHALIAAGVAVKTCANRRAKDGAR